MSMKARPAHSRRKSWRPALEPVEDRTLLATFSVTTTADSGMGSLRQAIIEANSNPGADSIEFNIPASTALLRNVPISGFDPVRQLWTISLQSPLPTIIDTVTIDGLSQADTGVPYRYPAQLDSTVQSLSMDPGVTGGTFTLGTIIEQSAPIPWNASAQAVQAALQAVYGPGNVRVEGGPFPDQLMTITFIGDLAGQPVNSIIADTNGLVGGIAPRLSINTLTLGGLGIQPPVLILSSPNSTEPLDGYNARLRVIVDGSQIDRAAYPDPTGFVLQTSHSNLRGLIIRGFDDGVVVPPGAHVGNRIQGNAIGGYFFYLVDPQTGEPLPSPTNVGFQFGGATGEYANTGHAVVLGSTNATVGGSSPQDANIITENGGRGVWIQANSEGNIVLGNQIGVAGPVDAVYAQAGNGLEGVLVESSSNAVGGAVAGAGNVISANGSHGVRITGQAAIRNRVEGNYIGVAPGGGYRFGSGDPGNQGDGVLLENAPANRIGGSTELQRNVISGNEGVGVRITGAPSSGNTLLGNYIGLTAGGDAVLGNSLEGVRIENSAYANTVGAGNVISGNLRGIYILGPTATRNLILDSFVGTDAQGVDDLGNSQEGVRIENSADNQIVASQAGALVISGNNVGVAFVGPGATRNLLAGAYIGVDAFGDLDLNNSQQGVLVENAPGNSIGGTTAARGNVISANHWGIDLVGGQARNNLIQGNRIGTSADGQTAMGNEVDGIRIRLGASENLIGGNSPGAGNIIAFNRRDGIRIEDDSIRNAILTNSIFDNANLGIDLFVPADPANGVTPNDPGDADSGPNQLQNAPDLTLVRTSLAFTNIQGTIQSTPSTLFRVQFFANPTLDPLGSGEGMRYLGEGFVLTTASGLGSFSLDVAGVLQSGEFVTATATDPLGNTSEFSAGIAEQLGTVQFAMAGYEVNEAAGNAVITIVRSGGSGGQATVQYATGGGSATPDVDYIPVSGMLIFDVGVNVQTFVVPILNDSLAEASETVGLNLSMPAGAATLGEPSTAILTILDDDQPGAIAFSMATYVVAEPSGQAIVTVVRSSGFGQVSVNYATAGGSAVQGVDYLPVTGTLVFEPGQTVQTFAVPVLINSASDLSTAVGLTLTNPMGGATLGVPSLAILFIQNVTAPRLISVSPVAGRQGTTAIRIAFNQALNATRAQDLRNYGYSVQVPGHNRRIGTREDLLVGIRSAVYDPATWTVTLTTTRPIPFGRPILVQINQVTDIPTEPVGVANLDGYLLDGNNDGRPGGAYSTVIQSSRISGKEKPRSPLAPVRPGLLGRRFPAGPRTALAIHGRR